MQEEQGIRLRLGSASISSGVKSEEARLVNNDRKYERKHGTRYGRTPVKCDYCDKICHPSRNCWERLAQIGDKASASAYKQNANSLSVTILSHVGDAIVCCIWLALHHDERVRISEHRSFVCVIL